MTGQRLRTALTEVIGDYDVILIDCPPALNPLTINALTAARGAVIVSMFILMSNADKSYRPGVNSAEELQVANRDVDGTSGPAR